MAGQTGTKVRTWRGAFFMPLLSVVVCVLALGQLTNWLWANVLFFLRTAPVLIGGVLVIVLMAIWLLIWRRLTLTTDAVIIRQWRRTYRIPLREIIEIRYSKPNKGAQIFRAVGFHTPTNKSMGSVSLGLSPERAMRTIADAVQAASGAAPKVVL